MQSSGSGGTVRVYRTWIIHPKTSETTVTSHKGVLCWIAQLPGGKAIPETGEDVDASQLDSEGRYIAARATHY
jgi:hypothetical protein